MPTIRGETDRGLRPLPGLEVGQAVLLVVAGAATWRLWEAPLPGPARAALAVLGGGGGVLLALGRWPPGGRGERLTVWIARLARFAAEPRLWIGGAIARRAGLEALRLAGVRRAGRDCRVLFCDGRDHAGRGPDALEAAQAAYLEFLHGSEGPVQVVSLSRWLTEADRPAAWDPAAAPHPWRAVAASYSRHWSRSVAGALLRRTCATVLVPPPAIGRGDSPPLSEAETALRAAAERMGLVLEVVSPEQLARDLRSLLGAPDSAGMPPPAGFWRVERAEGGGFPRAAGDPAAARSRSDPRG